MEGGEKGTDSQTVEPLAEQPCQEDDTPPERDMDVYEICEEEDLVEYESSGQLSAERPSELQNLQDDKFPVKLPAQDYDEIHRQCLSEGKLFEDPYFPADDSSLFFSEELPFKVEWKRPGDITWNPCFFDCGASRFDVSQGELGNCWLVAAIASLTQEKQLLSRVCPPAQYFELSHEYAGIFVFRFWHFGEWVDIVVDDRLPTYNGKLIFIHSIEAETFWSALLEKAYAKLHGGYECLDGGSSLEAMEDFTGGVGETLDLKEDEEGLFKKIQHHANRSSLMSCSIKATRQDVEAELPNGLIKGHVYSVTGCQTVQVHGTDVRLVRIRNPWGLKEWNGEWSDVSRAWNQLPEFTKYELCAESREDGEFWMSLSDLKKNFDNFEVCSYSIDQLYGDDNGIVKSWSTIIKSSSWQKSENTAGGCPKHPSFTDNPQFLVDFTEDDDGDGKCSGLITLMQKDYRSQRKMGVKGRSIGFFIYKAPDDGSGKLTRQWVKSHKSVVSSGKFTRNRSVRKRFDFEPGQYIIVPCTFRPNEDCDFLLRVFTEKLTENRSGAMTEGGRFEYSCVDKIVAGVPVDGPRKAQLRAMFGRYASDDYEVGAEELQDIFTALHSKDMKESVFSLDTCREMITMMLDTDNYGTLCYDEFQALFETIGAWKMTFFMFDHSHSGYLEKEEMLAAILSLGCNLSSETFTFMFNRFAKKRRYMNLDGFAACLSRIKIMVEKCKKLTKGEDKPISLTPDEFLQITLSA